MTGSSGVASSVEENGDDPEMLLRLYELQANIQLQTDTILHNRTSVVTLTQGLLLVAFQALVDVTNGRALGLATAVLGFFLSLSWIFLEQRNLAFFDARAEQLRLLEDRLSRRTAKHPLGPFHGLWTVVPQRVASGTRWYQRGSAPRILRLYLPALFALVWMAMGTWVLVEGPEPKDDVQPVIIGQPAQTP